MNNLGKAVEKTVVANSGCWQPSMPSGQRPVDDRTRERHAAVHQPLDQGANRLLVRYLNQGRADAERAVPSPRRLVSWLMSHPDKLPDHRRSHLDELLDAGPHVSVLAARVAAFADLLTARHSRDLDAWMASVNNVDMPALQGFVHGLRMDVPAVTEGLSLPYSNGLYG